MEPNQKSEALSQNLPLDILGEIFTIICGDYVYLSPMADQSRWILGHVCSHWRQVFWDTRSIWRKIETENPLKDYLYTVSSQTDRWRAIAEMLTFILEKTDSPLSLTIHQPLDSYLNIIVEQTERFSSLSLFSASKEAILRLLDLPPEAFPILERLILSGSHTGHYLIFNHVTSPFRTAPNLRYIKYIYNPRYREPLEVNSRSRFTTLLPWFKLEEIVILAIPLSLTELYDIWRISPNLRWCFLEIKGSGKVPSIQQIILSALQTLHLVTYDTYKWDDILCPIMAPALEVLYINTPKFNIPALTSFISRSQCPLKILRIHEEDSNEEEITGSEARDLFHHIPAVTKFTFSRTLSTSAVQSISGDALPNLAQANLRMSAEAFSSLLDMIDVYISKSRTLPFFQITCKRGSGFDEVRARYRIRRGLYRSEGVKIIVGDGETSPELGDDSEPDYSGLGYVDDSEDEDDSDEE